MSSKQTKSKVDGRSTPPGTRHRAKWKQQISETLLRKEARRGKEIARVTPPLHLRNEEGIEKVHLIEATR